MNKEGEPSPEELPLQITARQLGQELERIPALERLPEVTTSLGAIRRLDQIPETRNVPEAYRGKKSVFQLEIAARSVVAIHFSGERYGQDPTYFKRLYENSREVFGGKKIPGKKIAPSLLGYDDPSRTLLVEKAERDLSSYFQSNDQKRISHTLDRLHAFLKEVWASSREDSQEFCRYVDAFVVSEYDFLKGKKATDYLHDQEAVRLYQATQQGVSSCTRALNQVGVERGLAFSDVKPANMVEDQAGNILFIDVEKPGYGHYLSMLGQFYEGVLKEAPYSLFAARLKQKIAEILSAATDPGTANKLVVIGRINRLLIPYTLRNLVFSSEIGVPPDETSLKRSLQRVRQLLRADSPEKALA